jgi:ribosome-associated toxin RatA of RatAB toxin-antitoxin module
MTAILLRRLRAAYGPTAQIRDQWSDHWYEAVHNRAPGGGSRAVMVRAMANITGTASTEIDAPLDAVWAVVQDVEHWAQWQGTLGEVTPTERDADGRVSECKAKIDAKITQISMTLACAYAPQTSMTFKRVSGDLSSLAGSWQLDDLGDGRTKATYTLDVDPGGVIGFLLNDERKEKLRALLVDARPDELKARVAGG